MGTTTATQVYGQGGSFTSNTPNLGPNGLNTPAGVALDSGGNLYIADLGNNRVLFYPSGSTTATRVYGQSGDFDSGIPNNGGISTNSLDLPNRIALDGNGNLYVPDQWNHRVLVFENPRTTTSNVLTVNNASEYSERYGQDTPFTIVAELNWPGSGVPPAASAVTIGGNGHGAYGPTTCGVARVGNSMYCYAAYTPTAADLAGAYTETAAFAGDFNYLPSSSPQTNNFTITQTPCDTNVACTPNPAYVLSLPPVMCRARTVCKNEISGPPPITGSVTWSANTGCQPSPNPLAAACTTSILPVGSDAVIASYSGDNNYNSSTGSSTEVVKLRGHWGWIGSLWRALLRAL